MTGPRAWVLVPFLLMLGGTALLPATALAGPCDPPNNEIVCENSKAGTPSSVWDVEGAGSSDIQGFATEISVDQGETIEFKVETPSTKYRLDIYRMGYYGGDGARKVATVAPSAGLPQSQPPCDLQPSTGLVDCGKWGVSASWKVPGEAVSGIYFAHLVREDKSSEGSHIVFVVRDDDGESDLLFQTSDTTWQAYNEYGSNSLYTGGPGSNPGRAYKVSYNRPLTVRETSSEDSPFNAEYPMVRWLERNGYDVSYFSGVDTDRRGAELLEHEVFLSVGHDEYWSGQQRVNVEAARDAGVSLAFFSGNEIFWKTRWENSIDASETEYRTLVCYKETHANEQIDPAGPEVWTGTWRDPRFSPPGDGGRPENELSGNIFMVNSGTAEIKVPAADGALRFWRNTDIATLEPGATATLGESTLGYEWDEDADNGFRPPGTIRLSSTTEEVPQKLLDHGSTYGPGEATHHLTMYRAASGALVFGAGTIQWSWGLDEEHDRGSAPPDARMQQATVNLFADMGVQPQTLQAGLVAATQTGDELAPSTTIGAPLDEGEVELDEEVTISGTATDSEGESEPGGAVGGVEVSVDGGETWHPAQGRENWSYAWFPEELGEATILARAADDSGNLEQTPDEITVAVVPLTCPCSIWNDTLTGPQDPDTKAVELGVKFRSETAGYISGLRFYKTAANEGTHIGRLWTAAGEELAEVTFTGESASGWQQASFDTPVPIEANTTYIASYHAPQGKYASIKSYFAVSGFENAPLYALADDEDGPNGIYKYGAPGALFASGEPDSFQSENYLVDVVFELNVGPDTTPPVVNSRSPVDGSEQIGVETPVKATFNEAIDPATVSGATVQLRDAEEKAVAAGVSYDAEKRQVTLDPTAALQEATTYTATIKGGPGGVADLAGNPLAADEEWSFKTTTPPPPPPDEGPGGPILVISNTENPFSRYYGEILEAEGLNEYTVADIATITPAVLAARDVAILGEGAVSAAQASMLSEWVQEGGNLIAMRPDPDLTGLLGLSAAEGTLGNAYLEVDTGSSPGAGIVGETIQFHGSADRYTAESAQTVATLFSDSSTSTGKPAVTLRSVGSKGGHAAAFTYDLARSIVYTRQGNPAWNEDERDGLGALRSDDLFFGAKAGDVQPDWIDFNKVDIPQADEQQRLLTNLIGLVNLDRKPLPRFWFLPRDEKAAVVMTGDDHANNGTTGRFEQEKTQSEPSCSVANWECVRSTSYIYPNTPISDEQAAQFASEGFELALHVTTGCSNWDNEEELGERYDEQLGEFSTNFPSLPPPRTSRTHCIIWSDWASQPKVELARGIRLDTNYYYWPGSWVQNRPGLFTGSALPMRFADLDGSLIDVYQATTQLTDESEQTYPFNANALLDRALGAQGFYGVFTANMHTDKATLPEATAIVESAQEREVPIVSARQMLTWLDGRNQSSFGSVEWAGNQLSFEIEPGEGANGLRAMLPTESAIGPLANIKRGETTVTTTTQTIKGVEYAFFDAAEGSYTATYTDESLPVISNIEVTAANNGTATVTWETDEPADSRVDYGTSPGSLELNVSDSELVTSHSLELSGLEPDTIYHFRVSSADGEANTSTEPGLLLEPQKFTTPPAAPVLSETVPASPANENAPKVVGTATAGTTVELFTTNDCSGAAVATGTAAELETGITAGVSDNSSTSFRATATSGAGSSTCSAALAYVEDSGAPDTQITLKPAALVSATTAKFEFSGDDGAGSGIASFQCRIDSTDPEAWAACSSPREYTELSDGSHTFEARAIDNAGNADGSPASSTWTIDTIAPETQIDAKPAAATSSAAATFEFSGNDGSGSGIASFECRKDGGVWTACSSPQEYAELSEGVHSFDVKAVDEAGNADASPASFEWTVDTIAPETQIDAKPAALVNSATANFEFSGDDGAGSGIASFQCRLDSSEPEAWAACSSPREYTGLAEGAHKFEVKAIDNAGNADASPASFAWTVDTEAPETAIDAKPAAIANSATAKFEFGGDDGSGSGIASFECRRDEGAWAACASPQEYTELAEGAHSFEVKAIDNAGNVDASPASFEWQIDLTAPTAVIDSLSKTLVKAGESTEVTWHADENGSFELRLGGADCTTGSALTSGNYSDQPATHVANIAAAELAEGANTLRLCVTDAAGNTGSATDTVNKDTGAPETQIDAKPATLAGSATATFEFSGNDAGGSGVASFECRLDEGAWAACTSPREYTELAEGNHKFEVKAIDNAGNVDASPASFEWSIDSKAPETQIDAKPAALDKSVNAKFEFSGSDVGGSGVASFECRRDSTEPSAWQPCVSPLNYTSLAEGAHSFEVKAIDKAGNADPTPATYEWSIDSKAPETQIDAKPAALVNVTTAKFEFSGSDVGSGVASFQCRIDSSEPGAWAACTSPREYAELAEGAHSFEVRSVDNAGNVDGTPASFNWTIDLTAPSAVIDSLSKTLVKAGESTELTWHADENGAFELRLGGADCTTGTILTSGTYSDQPATHVANVAAAELVEGANTLRLCVTDAAGNTGSTTDTVNKDTGAPETQIDANPAAITNSTAAKFEFSGSDAGGSGVASFECRKDGGTWAACASPQEYTELSEGAHSFEVKAIDNAGNVDASPATFEWTIETVAPETTIDVKPPALASGTTAQFEFSGDDAGGSGIASFECRIDSNSPKGWAACSSPHEYTELAEGVHEFEVKAIDKAGNVDPSPATYAWTIDSKAPETQIDAKPAALVNVTTAKFEFSGSDSKGSGIASFQCRLDSADPEAWAACVSPREYTELSDGSHTFEVRAIDNAGNADGSPASYTWTVDTTGPQIQVDSGPAAFSSSADANFAFSATDPGGSGVATIECHRDAEAWTPCSSPRFYSALAEGAHTFDVRATDNAGNLGQLAVPYGWTIDTIAPTTQIDAKPAALANSATAKFEFSGTDGGSGVASFECRRDEGTWAACASPREYTELAEGAHSFDVKAIDKAGNADATPASFNWTIDLTAPTAVIDSLSKTLVKAGESTEVTWHADENGSFELRLGGADCATGTILASGNYSDQPATHVANVAASELAEGANTLRLCVTDAAGNTGQATDTVNKDTGAPETQIDLNPEAITNSTAAKFEFSGSDAGGSGVASFECRKDGGTWATCSSPREYTELAEGTHSFEVKAIDNAGNVDASPTSFEWTVDTAAPETAIDVKPAALANSATAKFEFSGDDGSGAGVASFECRKDGGTWGACSSPQEYTELGEGEHSFDVKAIDKAGNVDTTPAGYNWQIDLTPPSVQVDSGPTGLTNDPQPTFGFSFEAGAGAECSIDKGTPSFGPCSGANTHTPASPLADDSYTFRVRATDAAGNQAVATRAFSVEATAPDPPQLTSTDPASPANDNNPQVIGTAPAETTVKLYTSSDCTGAPVATGSAVQLKAGIVVTVADNSTTTYRGTSTTVAEVTSGCSEPISYIEDSIAPDTAIDTQPPALDNSATAKFELSGTDPAGSGIGSFICRIDSTDPEAWAPCSSPKQYNELAEGSHKFEVKAVDNAGNVDPSPASYEWQIDLTAPTAVIDSLSKTLVKAGESTEVTWHADENGSFELRLGGADCATGTILASGNYSDQPATHVANVAASELSEGANTLRLCVTDAAGNTGSATDTVNKDTGAPETSIDAKPAVLVNVAGAEFEFSGSDAGGSGVASFECRRDGGGWAACTSPKQYTELSEGTHSFDVKAIDKAGNVDASPASFEWQIDLTAPTAVIDSLSKALVKAGESTELTWHADENGSFELRLGGADCATGAILASGNYSDQPATHVASVAASELSEGANTLRLCVTDAAGNTGSATDTVTKDTGAPETGIDAKPAALVNVATAEFEFSGSDAGGSGVASFECRRDEGTWAPCTSPKQYTELAEGAHSFDVKAIDKAGNVDATPASFEWTVDTVAPETTIDAKPAAIANSAGAEFEFSADDGSGSGIATIECRRDGGTWAACTSPKQYAELAEGAHSFDVKAIDNAGNVDASPASFEWQIDLTAPTAVIDSLSKALVKAGESTELTWHANENGSFELRLGGADCATGTILTSGNYSDQPATHVANVAASELAEGANTLRLCVTDAAGNTGSATDTVNKDTGAPETSIDAKPAALVNVAGAEFEFSGSDAGGSGVASFECRRDGGSWAACSSPKQYTELAEGAHSFDVKAIDNAGNVDASPASFEWQIDLTAPTAVIDSLSKTLVKAGESTEVTWHADENGSFELRLGGADCATGSVLTSGTYSDQPATHVANVAASELSEGTNTLRLCVTDAAGNTGPATDTVNKDTGAPETGIDAKPAALVNVATAEFEFSGSDAGGSGIASFECRRDGGEWAACTSPKQYTELAEGAHSFDVKAIDKAGNVDATPASYEWTVDTVAPETSIDAKPAAIANSAGAEFEFSADDGSGSGIATIECRRDGGTWAACTSPKQYTELSEGAHKFEVKAIDNAGNVDASPASFEWTVDTVSPETTIDAKPASLVSSTSAEFEFSGSDAGGSGIASFECRIDSTDPEDWAACASPREYTELAEGAHKFEVRAIDKAGNPDPTPASVEWTIDSKAPETQIDAKPAALVSSANAEFEFSGSDAGGSGVASFECRRDGGSWAACSSPKQYTELSDGAHSFEVKAIDNAGNADVSPASFEWTVDTVSPETTIDAKPAALVNVANAEFEFSGSDAGGSGVASLQCRLDSSSPGAWAACTSPKQYSGLSDGEHSFEVRAIDNADNADATPAGYTWTVDTAAPGAPELTETDPASPANNNNPKIIGTAPAATTIKLYTGADCTGSPVATASAAELEAGISVSVADDSTTAFRATATTVAENTSGCSGAITYVEDSTAPGTTIDAKPAALANSASASFEFSGSDVGGSGVASFECRRDGGGWAACTSPKQYTELAEGTHSFDVKAIDKAGNVDASPASFNWTIDLTAPAAVIDSLSKTLVKAGESTELTWHADENGSFELRLGGADCTTGSVLASGNYSDQPATHVANVAASELAEGANTLRLCVTDAAGNTGPATDTVNKDTGAPETSIDAKPAALVNVATAEFEFSGSDAGGSGVASFECRRDGGGWAACTSPKQYTELAEGTHSFDVKAIDKAGNADGTPASFEWTVDTVGANTAITANPLALSNSTSAKFEFEGEDAGGSGVASFECRRDGGEWTACTSPRNYSALAEGAHEFEVKAVDNAGNPDPTPASFEWTIDSKAPETQIDAKPAALVSSAGAEFEFSGSDTGGSGVASFECRRDGGAWAACTSPKQYTELAEGSHEFEVKAIDNAGNADASPASFEWTVDTVSPDTSIDAKPAALVNVANAEFEFSGSDAGGSGVASLQCRLDSSSPGAWAACTSPKQYTELSDGEHSFETRSIDNAGNTDATPAAYTWTVDTAAPGAPELTETDPVSPANDNNPKIIGTAPAATTIKLYTSADCTGSPVATTGAAELEAGITVSVADDSTTAFRATATTVAENTSGCSGAITYVEDSTAPGTTIDAKPATLANSASASFEFSGSDVGGSGVASFECRRDGGSWAACTSPKQYTELVEGSHEFEVKAIDNAGNVDASPASYEWAVDTKAPETSIDAKPAAFVSSKNAKFEFSGSDTGGSGIASYECSRDGEGWTPCTSPRNYSALAEGSHEFEVRAIDNAGNIDPTPATATWVIDTIAPDTQIDAKPAALANSATAEFEFSGSDAGGSGIASLECRRDGGSWAACSSPQEYSGLSEGSHEFEVKAIDNAGNVDGTPATYEWTVDTVSPDTSIDAKPAALVNVATAEFEFSGTDAGGSGVASLQCRLDSASPGAWAACTSPKQYSGLGDGEHTFETRAIDNAGNTDPTPAAYTWTVDTAAPGAPELTETDPASPANDNNPKIIGTAPAATTIKLYTSADCTGSPVATAGAAELEAGITVSVADDSTTAFRATATTVAENTSGCSDAITYVEDSTAPGTTIDAKPAALANSATATFEFSGTDAGGSGIASFECRRDGGSWAACTSSKQYTGLSEGNHSFEVKAIDNAGNVDASPASYEWQIDLTAPSAVIDSLSKTLVKAGESTEVTWHADENGSFELRLGGADCTAGTILTSGNYSDQPATHVANVAAAELAEGANTLRLCVTDAAGNTGQATDTVNKDTGAPDTSIDAKPAALVNVANAEFEFSGSDSGGSGIASLQCRLDSSSPGAWAACTSPKQYSGLSDGEHSFETRAIDNAGNIDPTPAAYTWTVDTAAPGAPELTETDPASPANDNNPKIIGTAPAATTIKLYTSADCTGSPVATASAAELEAGISVSVADDSTTAFRATATTVAENTSGCSDAITYVEDSTAPGTTIGSHPAAVSDSSTASFGFSGTDAGGSGIAAYECRRDGGAWSACSSPKQYTGLADGAHVFDVRAIDKAGNVDASPATFAWAIDTTEPEQQSQSTPEAPQPAPEEPEPTLEQAELVRVLRNPKNGTAQLIFKVPAPGLISAQAPEISLRRPKGSSERTAADRRRLKLLQRRIKPKRIRISKPGTVSVPIVLGAAGKKLLSKSHRLKVKVVIRYRATDGTKATWKIAVTLKKQTTKAAARRSHKKK